MVPTRLATVPHRAAPANAPTSHDNVIPFPPPRLLVPVTLASGSDGLTRQRLTTLLHSPLGVYVAGVRAVRNEIRVQLDIASEDIDFTLHTLIALLPDAVIGPVTRRLRVGIAGR
ncbi:hypothetical protein [Burkholderia sp. Ac-20353]|uniref:hypothetical protein n=1 Tax=Burkholderia sp. Ac-20353 TaxID=2703894 RepID=UPI00197C4B3F|nr:hypothetical protein [Burkholderia sp. Ac-20353]MBN3786725.1 hypothetical protein [Burkholderia sp. Ac-20353]